MMVLPWCVQRRVPIVVATTGHNMTQRQEIERTKGIYIEFRAQALPRIDANANFQDTQPTLNSSGGTITLPGVGTISSGGQAERHVVGGDELDASFARGQRELLQAPPVITAIRHRRTEPNATGCGGGELPEHINEHCGRPLVFLPRASRGGGNEVGEFRNCTSLLVIVPGAFKGITRAFFARGMGRHEDEEQSFLPGKQILEAEDAFAFGGAKLAEAQEPAQPSIGRAIARIGENFGRAVDEDKAAADER